MDRTSRARRMHGFGMRALDAIASAGLLFLSMPVVILVAIAIKVDDGGSVFFRARRVGHGGREFVMLKFRKMRMGSTGSPLTTTADERFTRLGHFLAGTKLDELPQLWNVLRGQMSLVGPRPEDPDLVARDRELFVEVLSVKPGITGLAQLAYAKEGEVLGGTSGDERIAEYFDRVLPQKLALDRLYAREQSLGMYLRVLWWTLVAVVLRKSVAVDRGSGKLGLRQRRAAVTTPSEESQTSTTEANQAAEAGRVRVSA